MGITLNQEKYQQEKAFGKIITVIIMPLILPIMNFHKNPKICCLSS